MTTGRWIALAVAAYALLVWRVVIPVCRALRDSYDGEDEQ